MKNFDDAIWKFLQDDSFIKWVTAPDTHTSQYWNHWQEQHPEQQQQLLDARAIAEQLHLHTAEIIPAGMEADIHRRIEMSMEANDSRPVIPLSPVIGKRYAYRIAAAAALLLIISATFLLLHSSSNSKKGLAAAENDPLIIRTNTGMASTTAYLTDGSMVMLQTGASIRHHNFLQNKTREVFLQGEAFFDVAKDTKHPFIVFTDDIAIKVLGTSFNIRKDNTGKTVVTVVSGKVAVCPKADTASSYVVTANHQLSFDPKNIAFHREQPVTGNLKSFNITNDSTFIFDETHVLEVFASLEKAYRIKIHVDEKTYANAKISSNLANQSFEHKLDIICAGISATYTITDGEVFISQPNNN
ncbi:FecR family protein [Chitinophaga sp. Cy-1792]|uniref:FecR family protein n=1 Tax=Chitinophaga sp. Cy-1792 TaxID=2608339 RepID=UPI0014236886|nr:FecR family protein [Chitinophaga sp. Cy-1792]NIG56383.1 FecR family protein [Chitinophaga sp. Cy-1792]